MLVFQYGSNTSAERLNGPERLRGDAVDMGRARTRNNHELAFTVWSESNHCAAADLRLGGISPAWGVLYEIPADLVVRGGRPNRKSLDEIEGRAYERRPIGVVLADGTSPRNSVCTYTVREPRQGLRTELAYLQHILLGLKQHHAPDEYVSRVKQIVIENNPELRDALK